MGSYTPAPEEYFYGIPCSSDIYGLTDQIKGNRIAVQAIGDCKWKVR